MDAWPYLLPPHSPTSVSMFFWGMASYQPSVQKTLTVRNPPPLVALLLILVAFLIWFAIYTSAISTAELPRPNITRHQFFSSALTGVVAIGVNKSNTVWCSASSRVMGSRKLQNLVWVYSNKTRLPAVNRGQSSGYEVYVERYYGSSGQDYAVWRRVLHFKTTKPSSAGNYTCVASYKGNMNSHQSVEIRVSGE